MPMLLLQLLHWLCFSLLSVSFTLNHKHTLCVFFAWLPINFPNRFYGTNHFTLFYLFRFSLSSLFFVVFVISNLSWTGDSFKKIWCACFHIVLHISQFRFPYFQHEMIKSYWFWIGLKINCANFIASNKMFRFKEKLIKSIVTYWDCITKYLLACT